MLVWDTGASIGLTPFRSDFIDYLPLDGVTVKDIARTNSVLGIGTIMWKLPTTKGHPVFIPAVAYHMPDCDIRLFSPQSYFNLHGGDATVTARSVMMHLPDKHVVNIPINPTVNLPVIPHPGTGQLWPASSVFNCGQYTASIRFGKASLLQGCS